MQSQKSLVPSPAYIIYASLIKKIKGISSYIPTYEDGTDIVF
jgi:hypothetical protein